MDRTLAEPVHNSKVFWSCEVVVERQLCVETSVHEDSIALSNSRAAVDDIYIVRTV